MQYGEGRLQALSGDSLSRLHRTAIDSRAAIRALLERVRNSQTVLGNGVDWRSTPRHARVLWVGEDRVGLEAEHIECGDQPQIYFQFELDRGRYFFAAPPIRGGKGQTLEVGLPSAIYEMERRDLARERREPAPGDPRFVEMRADGMDAVRAEVRDWSYQGLGVSMASDPLGEIGSKATVRFLDGDRAGELHRAELRHRMPDPTRVGWTHLGLATTQVEQNEVIEVEVRERILDEDLGARTWRRIELASAVAREAPSRALARVAGGRASTPEIEVVDYANDKGQAIRAIVDSTGERRGAPAVLIAPAWGRTKETLLPLAATLVRTFERAGQPLTVLRFDGTNRRGESYIDPECREPGNEYLHFTFSQAVRDIEAGVDFLEKDPRFEASKILLVTYSLGAVEGRRAVRQDAGRRIAGWISVVGMVDLQSGLRTVSGGVDYAYGLTRGVRFGRHELVGVTADMDHTGLDALAGKLVFAEDAHRDMQAIRVPVTWLHGRYDAWMDLERVQRLVSAGDIENRRLIEVPTGHQMRSSREAVEAFQLVATEASRILLGQALRAGLPDFAETRARTEAERQRRPQPKISLREFWTDYLLGRDRTLGIELMTATSAYRELMALQIDRLGLQEGDRVADLGAGTGDFPVLLAAREERPSSLQITEVDYVCAALRRGQERFEACGGSADGIHVRHLAADLDVRGGSRVPLAPSSFDAVIASLLISYLGEPDAFLESLAEVIRPSGRLVLSTLRRDADISKVYVQGIAELPPDRVEALFGVEAARDFESLQRRFLNDAARLLDLEEAGEFRFFDEDELAEMARKAGFVDVRTEMAFGDPAQAVVLTARRGER